MKDTFLSSGVYGCVYHPPYDCNGETIKKKEDVSKIVKDNFTTKTEVSIGQILKKDGFITVYKKCKIHKKQLKQSKIVPKCKLFHKDPDLKQNYVLLYSKFIKSVELATYLKKNSTKSTILKVYFLICKRIETMIDNHIIHFDLHFGNIMYNGDKLHVIDFGLSLLQKQFYDNGKPNYAYLKDAIYKFAPSWNYWTLEYHLLCYIIHNGELTIPIIEHTINYYIKHHKIIKGDFAVKYKSTAFNYFIKYARMAKDDIVMDLLKYSNTWDFYKNGLHFINIYNDVKLDIPNFIMLLLIMIHPIPEYRPSVENVRQFNSIFIRLTNIDNSTVSAFSKILSHNLTSSIKSCFI